MLVFWDGNRKIGPTDSCFGLYWNVKLTFNQLLEMWFKMRSWNYRKCNNISISSVKLPIERPGSPDKQPGSESQTPVPDERPGTGKSDRPRSKSPRSPKGNRSKSPREKSPKGSKSRSRTPSGKKRDKSKEKEKLPEVPPPPEGGKR